MTLGWYDARIICDSKYKGVESLTEHRDFLYHMTLGKRFTVLYDRTSMVRFPLKPHRVLTINPLTKYDMSFSDACDLRAIEIIKKAEENDQLIYMLWSGGIDSTCMLAALIKNSTDEQKKRFVILLSSHSIVENPLFFNQYIIGKLKYQSSLTYLDLITEQNDMLLHAECSDQLFPEASGMGESLLSDIDAWKEPYAIEHLGKVWEGMYHDKNHLKEFYLVCKKLLNFCIKTAEACNVELKTVIQVKTWYTMNFAFAYKMLQPYNLGTGNLKLECFYYSDAMDQWAMHNLMKTEEKSKIYKREAKAYIYDLDKNEDYYLNKDKVMSGIILRSGRKRAVALDGNFKPIPVEELVNHYQPSNWISDARLF